MKETIDVVWPLGKATGAVQALAPRLNTLEGKTICGVFNAAFYFDETWPMVKQLLSRQYRGIKFVGWEEFGLFFTEGEMELLKALRQA